MNVYVKIMYVATKSFARCVCGTISLYPTEANVTVLKYK
jgi:hypothetical protein